MAPEAQAMVAKLRVDEQALEQAMRHALATEIAATIDRWKTVNCPPGKFARQDDHDEQSKAILRAWTYMAASLVYDGKPWEAAFGERLYTLAVGAAHSADTTNEGLDLHKGIDYFMLGMAQLYQGKYQEAAHSILLAVIEDEAAGFPKPEETVAAEKLREYTLGPVLGMLRPAADLCRAEGLAHVTDEAVKDLATALFYRDLNPPGGDYYPSWVLWLFRALKGLQDLPGPAATAVTPVRRLEALQDLTFFYEALFKSRYLVRGTLKDVAEKVSTTKGYIPSKTAGDWGSLWSYDPSDPLNNADARLSAIKSGSFGLPSGHTAGMFCCRAIVTLGLVRNATHHYMDLSSAILETEYEWVHHHVLAALLLSW